MKMTMTNRKREACSRSVEAQESAEAPLSREETRSTSGFAAASESDPS